MLVTAIEARPVRSLDQVRVELEPGIVSVVGPNGVGKTNLVEALYFALTGRSFRTSDRRDLIPFGASLARAEATVRDADGLERRLLASVSRTEGRRHLLDGSPADPATLARNRPPVAVFAPDRLSLIKGPPSERRAHLDGFLAARWPARGELRKRFGQALAQRNALLSRLAAGHGGAGAAGRLGRDPGRGRGAADRRPRRGDRRAERALRRGRRRARPGGWGELEYAPRADGLGGGDPGRAGAAARAGPAHWAGAPGARTWTSSRSRWRGRSLRRYGSQGQQRAALLALLFAEREVLLKARRVTPLLLLDDVMSELDPGRRERLVQRLDDGGQALITAADEESLPAPALAVGGADAAARRSRARPPREPPPRSPRRPRRRSARRASGPPRGPAWRRCRRPGRGWSESSWRRSRSRSPSAPGR